MLPYAATDLLRVMQNEMQTEDERRFGAYLARDIRRDEDNSFGDENGPDRGERVASGMFFRHEVELSGSA